MQQLDASLFTGQAEYTDSQFLDEIRAKTQAITRRRFPDSFQRQQVRQDSNGLVIACPYCGDSATNASKKRGHILLKGKWAGYYKCFNCGAFVQIPKFMSDFDETLTLSGIKYVQDHKQDIQTLNSSSNELTADIFRKSLALEYGIDRTYFRNMFSLLDISPAPQCLTAYNYLCGRMQYHFEKFLYDPKTNYVLILNLCEKKIIGLQMRSLSPDCPKDKRFLTFNLERIYRKFMRSSLIIPTELNTLSMIFDIYNVNVYKPVIVTEGPMDAFLLPNAIATAGANKHLPVELPFWYMYDADETGTKHALEKIKDNQKVFLWGKLKKELGLPYREKWDVNDVVLWCRENYGKEFRIKWLDYFSDNSFDMLYLDSLGSRL